MSDNPNRIDSLSIALPAGATLAPDRSPTGKAVISPKVVPVAAVGAALVIVGEEIAKGGHWDAARVTGLVVKLIPTILGVLSPGWRK
jgi:hypothetical protein